MKDIINNKPLTQSIYVSRKSCRDDIRDNLCWACGHKVMQWIGHRGAGNTFGNRSCESFC